MLKKKLRECKAESLVEVLVTILVVAMAMTVLAAGIGTAAKITAPVNASNASFVADRKNPQQIEVVVKVSGEDKKIECTGYITENGYYYYE